MHFRAPPKVWFEPLRSPKGEHTGYQAYEYWTNYSLRILGFVKRGCRDSNPRVFKDRVIFLNEVPNLVNLFQYSTITTKVLRVITKLNSLLLTYRAHEILSSHFDPQLNFYVLGQESLENTKECSC